MDQDTVAKAIVAAAVQVIGEPVDKTFDTYWAERYQFAKRVLDNPSGEAGRAIPILEAVGAKDDVAALTEEFSARWNLFAGVDPRAIPNVEVVVRDGIEGLKAQQAAFNAEKAQQQAQIDKDRAAVDARTATLDNALTQMREAFEAEKRDLEGQLAGFQAAVTEATAQLDNARKLRDQMLADYTAAITARDDARLEKVAADAQAAAAG